MKKASEWNQIYKDDGHLSRWQYDRPTQELVGVEVCGLIPSGGHCLDLGCGVGRESVFLAECGYQVQGIDLSEKAVALANDSVQADSKLQATFQVGDVLKLPFEDASFDFAMDRGCFHHVAMQDRSRYATELSRVLKQGASCLLRGCRSVQELGPENKVGFNEINEDVMREIFAPQGFTWSPLRKITLISMTSQNGNGLPAFVTILKRK